LRTFSGKTCHEHYAVGSWPAWPTANHRRCAVRGVSGQGFHIDDRRKILDDGNVRLEFKRPWSDGDGRGEAPCVAVWEAARPSRFPLTQFKAP
jgi:hypothetical protein